MSSAIASEYRTAEHAVSMRRSYIPWVCFVAALYFAVFFIEDQYIIDMMFQIMLAASLAGAWNIVGGFAGQIALGHAAFFGVGAYTSTLLLLHFGLSPWIGMLVGAVLAAILAAGIGAVTLRLRGPFFAMTTVAFTELVRITVINWESLTGGTRGLWIPWNADPWLFGFADRRSYLLVATSLAVLVFSATAAIAHSKLGYVLKALREDTDAARSVGVRATAVKLTAFAISAALAALGGTLYTQYALSIDPTSVLSFDISIQMALMSAVGGIGTIIGPAIGAATIVTTSSLLRGWLGGQYGALHLLLYGCLFIFFMLYLRGGLVGLFSQLAASMNRLLRNIRERR